MNLLAVVLSTVVIVLTPLALGSPIDPSWCAGFWDNGDFDDVVLVLTAQLHSLGTADRFLVGASKALSERFFERQAGTVEQHAYEPGIPRAPPT